MDNTSTQPLFSMSLQVRWRDLDIFNHVNNSNFLTYVEEARIRWFEALGERWVTDDSAPLLAAVQMNYRAPVPYPAGLRVELHGGRVGNSSVTIHHRIVDREGGPLYADGHVVMVWVGRASGRPVPLPDAIRRMAQRQTGGAATGS